MVPPCPAVDLGNSITYGNMKQWITQRNLFNLFNLFQRDHAKVLNLLTHFDFESVSSHMTNDRYIFIPSYTHFFVLSQL